MSKDNGLPKGWATATIGQLIGEDGVFNDGDWVESKDQDPTGDVRLIQLADVGDGRYVNKSSRFLTHDKALALHCTFLEKNDVLIARMPDPLGRACIFPGDAKTAVTVVDVCVVRTGKSKVDHRWLMWFVNAPRFRTAVASLQSGSTRKRISRKNLATIRLPVPPLNEQRRIVAKIEELFSDLDAGIAALERAKANLKRYRAAVLKAAVEGKLTEEWRAGNPTKEPAPKLLDRILKERRKKWEEDQLAAYEAKGKKPPKNWRDKYKEPVEPGANLPALPEGWCWATVEQLGNVQLGRQRSPKNRSKDYPTKYIRAANLTEEGLALSDVLDMEFKPNEVETYRLAKGDIVVSEASGSPDQVGKPAVWNDELPLCCFQNTVIRLRPHHPASSLFFLTAFQHCYFNKVFAKVAAGVGINHLSAAKFSRIAIPLAPEDEQAEVVAEVERRLSILARSEVLFTANLKRATRLRQSILKRAFEGNLVPQDPNDGPASELLDRIQQERKAANATDKQPKRGGRRKRTRVK